MDTLMHLFDWVLAASTRASLLTVVVLGAQALLGHRLPARWRHALWLPVLAVLLMPVFPESSWSISSITRTVGAPLPELSLVEPSTTTPSPSITGGVSDSSEPLPWRQILCLVWLSGAAGMLLFGAITWACLLRRLANHRIPVSDDLQRELTSMAREIGLRRLPRAYASTAIRSPAVTGVLRPVLLLPAQFEHVLAAGEARFVLKHELMHIKRGDLQVNALLCLLLALHWYHPLFWLAFFRVRQDREAACDAQVLEGEAQPQRIAYGHTLLKVESVFSSHGLSLGFVGIFQRGAALRARIRLIASPPPIHPLMKMTLSLAIVLLSFLGVTRAVALDAITPFIHIHARFVELPAEGIPLPAPLDIPRKTPGILGTLTDAQLQIILRGLSQRKGVDLFSAPIVATKDGHRFEFAETSRLFSYKDAAGKPATRECGISFTALPITRGNHQLDLDLSPMITEIDGFIRHESGWEEPVFLERKASVQTTITPGQTLVLEMDGKANKQTIQEADSAGRIISSKTAQHSRRTLVFVTAYVIDPVTNKPRTQ